MGDFRKVVVVFAALVLFAGLAAAQQPFACVASASVPPTIRTEGIAEQVGDIVLQCSGGVALAVGNVGSNYANITIFSSAPITSRLLTPGTSGTATSANQSEAILTIDDPDNSTVTQMLCANNVAGAAPGIGCGSNSSNAQTSNVGAYLQTTGKIYPNVYQGVVTSNQSITFFGVPVLPPGTSGGAAPTTPRVLRITNVRVNGSSAGGNTNVPGQVQMSISISGASSVPVNNPNQIVAYAQPGLTTRVGTSVNATTAATLPIGTKQCTTTNDSGVTRLPLAYLQFIENFGSAFKTRTGAPNAASNIGFQNSPGQIYNNSESGFIWPNGGNLQNGQYIAGLADSGTRLKAVFNNVPAGVRVYVSYANFLSSSSQGAANGTFNQASYAQLVATSASGEAVGDYSGLPAVTASPTTTDAMVGFPTVELPVINGQAVAVWEVVNSIPLKLEEFDFGVAFRWQGNPAANSPAPGTGTVNLSFAPINTTSPSFGQTIQLPIPRFADTSTASNLFQMSPCRTVLLFPYVTNLAGFDTGLAIANTSTDPFGTIAQAGICTLYPYGTGAPTNPINSPQVASGTVYTTLASTSMPGFQGYVIALCNFQYAHGFAFVSDLGARNIAMGYLALVIPDPGTGSRSAVHFSQNNPNTEEMLAQ